MHPINVSSPLVNQQERDGALEGHRGSVRLRPYAPSLRCLVLLIYWLVAEGVDLYFVNILPTSHYLVGLRWGRGLWILTPQTRLSQL